MQAQEIYLTGNSETFCDYLARQLMAKRGFSSGAAPEAQRLADQSDVILTCSDGIMVTVIAMIDREAHPGKAFTLERDELEEIGKACSKYAGRVLGGKAPVTIYLVEVGPASNDQLSRLGTIKRRSIFSRTLPSAWVIDTDRRSVWTTAGLAGRSVRQFIEGILTSPREIVTYTPPIAVAPPAFPTLTLALIATLCTVYAVEVVHGIGPAPDLTPSLATLVALGGLSRSLVFKSGEWFRLLSAPFLHADPSHLAMNCIALFIAGRTLERVVGRAWLGAIYVIGALCGGAASMLLNPAPLISIGASGAIMGLFATMLVVSAHFHLGVARTKLQMDAVYVLVPSLLPLAGAFSGGQVDYGAHFGGALGGAIAGGLLLAIWPASEPRPQWRPAAAALAIVAMIALTYPVSAVASRYSTMAFAAKLVPNDKLSHGRLTSAQARDLVSRYPHDPRGHIALASHLLDAGDHAGAERELRAALAEEKSWLPLFPAIVPSTLRTLLAIAIVDRNRNEALEAARPVCADTTADKLHALLNRYKLCGT